MSIAVVGSGVAGLSAAYLLGRTYEVDLYEAGPALGGHAHTIDVEIGDVETGGRRVALDTGFMVYNETTYPGFTTLLRELGVATRASDMSFGVQCDRCGVAWSSRGLGGFLAQPGNLRRPSHWRLPADLRRFHAHARAALAGPADPSATLGDFLDAGNYGPAFVGHWLRPLAAAVWSTPPGGVRSLPLHFFLRFLANHGMLGWGETLPWRTVRGGARAYVEALAARMEARVHLSTPVRAIERAADSVCLRLAGGSAEHEAVVLACHADDALALLDRPSPEERALAAIPYGEHRVVVHTDGAALPAARRARASWNYRTTDCRREGEALRVTYDCKRLQGVRTPDPLAISLNPAPGAVAAERILAELRYRHPRYTPDSLAAQAVIRAINGARNTYFAGAYLGYGFHEDGLQSAVRATKRLLARRPRVGAAT